MADPQQKSLELPNYLTRVIPFWGNPQWLEAERWRRVVRSQPIAIICRDHLITYLQALPWEIRPRDLKANLDDDVAYYTNFVLNEFDNIVDKLWQDALDLPVGGNVEVVRWKPNILPEVEHNGETYRCTKPWSKGHVYSILNMDGATIYPTYAKDFPIAQKIMEDINTVVYFKPEECARILLTPRPELRLIGYSMPPPERIYLALTMLFRGDQYYANLLLDTPEAGVLDLVDMQMEDAKQWVQSFRTMFENTIDPLKIGVLYEHKTPATWIPFGRPPTDMMFDSVTMKYGRIIAAGYWLTLGNIGLEAKGDTLAGSIREDQQVMKTGYGVIKEKTKNFLDSIIPPYLEWTPKEISYETLTGKGRAFLVYAQALKATKEAGALKPSEIQAQLISDGFITVEVEMPDDEAIEEKENKPALPFGGNDDQAKQLTDKVPPAEGGRGDVTEKADLHKYGSTQIDMPDSVVRQITALAQKIAPVDLHESGIEHYPHVTVKYGLLNDDVAQVSQVLSGFRPFSVITGPTSLFENDEFDVLKIEVEGTELLKLNKAIAALGSVDTHPGYNPHLTIAYLKKGTGQKYLDLSLIPHEVMVNVVSLSRRNGEIVKLPLGMYIERAIFDNGMNKVLSKAFKKPTDTQLLKLIKVATRLLFPTTQKAIHELEAGELARWTESRIEAYLTDKADLDSLDKALNSDKWWMLPESLSVDLFPIYKSVFSQAATEAAQTVQEFLYTEGLRDTAVLDLSFDLTNARTLAELESKAANLVEQLNDGTKFYLKRILASSVEEGLASSTIAKMIKEGAGLEQVLKQFDFTSSVIAQIKQELAGLTPTRAESIVNTEINRAESMGRLQQWQEMGLTRKFWRTFGNACEICKSNEALGFVEMSHVYDDVFTGTLAPPAHPMICRCHLEFDEAELIGKAGELKVWDGS